MYQEASAKVHARNDGSLHQGLVADVEKEYRFRGRKGVMRLDMVLAQTWGRGEREEKDSAQVFTLRN